MVEDSAVDQRTGSLFGPYRLMRLLGSGGFGEVYEAEDTIMHRVVALKLLGSTYSQNPVFRERLFREAHTAGRLREPHVVPIHGCGEIDGQIYIDMRLVRGVDLETVLRRDGTLDPARAVTIVRQIAAALDAAHAETVIHRDVKPANILLAGEDFASLVDFGLATAAGDARLTKPGKAVGTFDYVAPERLSGGPVDHRADIYSLACVLYECLTGGPPFAQHRDLPALMAAHMSAPIPLPSHRRPDIPAAFDDVIARGLAKNPVDRYPSAGALAIAAQRALGGGQVTRPWAPVPQPLPALPPPALSRGRKPRRRIVIAAAVALVAVVAAAAVLVGIVHRRPSQHAGQRTPRPSSTAPTVLAFPALAMGRGVAVDPAGNVYVAELGRHAPEGRVLKLAPGQSAPTELAFGEIYAPGVAADSAGNVYVADVNASNVAGVWKLEPGARGPSLIPFGHLAHPVSVAVGKDGSVFVVDEALQQVSKLAAGATSPIRLMPTTQLNAPASIAVDKDGNLYIVDTGDRRVLKLAPGADDPITLPFGGLDHPFGIAVDNAGNVYVSDPDKHWIRRLAPGATSATQVTFPGLNDPFGLATDKDGNLYVVECWKRDRCMNGRVLEIGTPQ